jgi:glucose-6-phosphate-specific signal transduction histidine kinase
VNELRDRVDRSRPDVLDGLIALAMLVEIELEAWLDTVVPSAHRLPAAIAAVALVAPVVVRRRWPAAAFVACAAVLGLFQGPPTVDVLNSITGTILPLLLLAFTAGVRLELRRGLAALAFGSALITGGAVWSTFFPEQAGYSLGAELIGSIVLPAAFWAFGRMSRERARRATAFRDLVALVERDREQHEHTATAEERVRIGVELQDIIAQNVSAIIIQAGGARQLIDSEPDQARDAILGVERSGREALADLRRTLGLLRADHDQGELAPQPGLSQLEALRNSVRMLGLGCQLHVEGERPDITAGVDLLGYRVIEATLLAAAANGPNHTEVFVGYGQRGLEIEVCGRLPVAGLDEQLHGISSRVALYDGTLQLEPLAEAGFALNAHLPLAVPAR